MPRNDIVLHSTYYHAHFQEMLSFVARVYRELLSDDDRVFLTDFQAVSPDAQCLYVRMVNRTRTSFHPRSLIYQEIEQRDEALSELRLKGFAGPVSEADYANTLNDLTKPELLALARSQDMQGIRPGASKPELIGLIKAQLAFADFMDWQMTAELIVPARRPVVAFFLYLYFGKLSDSMTNFALRDLGIVSVRVRDTYQSRFEDAAEARAGFFYSRTLTELKQADPARVDALIHGIELFPAAMTDYTSGLRDRVLFGLGQALEKRKENARAIDVYAQAASFECRERYVRLLYGAGERDRVQAQLVAMLESPVHDEEYVFASDFFARKFGRKRTGVFSDLLSHSQTIVADDLYRGFPESVACQHFESEGWACHHTENALWTALFGLVFWDLLFEGEGALNCGFDLVPQSLRNRTFHLQWAQAIAQRLQAIEDGQGPEVNGLFNWDRGLMALLPHLLKASPSKAVCGVLQRMAEDYYGLRDGFPDLMLLRDGVVRFIEIKAEGDVLRRNQLARLNLLKSLGYDAGICRLAYQSVPDQTYVVVDVETTGGRAANDRITEIGAVKIRNGEVVAEWHSLINPKRHIPAFITGITGIDDAMVADAPVFADIADGLEDFLRGSVFVAHNVNFDYGFIAQEYRRLERGFSYPKLCTCASMRKYYPGHVSYGLGPLCEDFSIRLDNHHRALDDARAAAGLLHLVMDKRADQMAAA